MLCLLITSLPTPRGLTSGSSVLPRAHGSRGQAAGRSKAEQDWVYGDVYKIPRYARDDLRLLNTLIGFGYQ